MLNYRANLGFRTPSEGTRSSATISVNSVVAFRLRLLSPVPLLGEEVLHRREAEGASELRELEQPREIGPLEVMMHDRERFAEFPRDVIGCHAGPLHEIVEPHGELPRSRRELKRGTRTFP